MPLKDLYQDQLAQKAAAKVARCASFAEAKARLAGLYHSIVDDRDFLDSIHAEVELLDDDLRIDPGKIMIVVTALETGDFRLEYEIKSSAAYKSVVVPEVKTIEDAERTIARLLVDYPRD